MVEAAEHGCPLVVMPAWLPCPVVKPRTDRGYRALWSMRLARKAGCCMPPPDRPEVLLHKARQDELVVKRLLGDRAGHEETPDSRTGSGAAKRGAGQEPVMMLLNGVEIGRGALEIDDAR